MFVEACHIHIEFSWFLGNGRVLKNAPNMLHYAGIALQPITLFIMLAYLTQA